MTEIYQCNNRNCSVHLFKSFKKKDNTLICPRCDSIDISKSKVIIGKDEFHCTNKNCPEYQITQFVDKKGIFHCPFCQSKQVFIAKHDLY